MAVDKSARLREYEAQGYTVFENIYDEDEMEVFRQEVGRLEEADGLGLQRRSWWFGDMLERSPALMWPVVLQPKVLDFVEEVIGPRVQLDNLTLASFPPVPKEAEDPQVTGWHRDRWGQMPTGEYQRPMALNTLTYLQDLTDECGSLRIVPRSHIEPTRIEDEKRQSSHPDEQLLYPKAGDVVLTHFSLLHSGTRNRSGRRRYLLSIYYNISWLKTTDTFGGPNCKRLIDQAREHNDHRALRLLGVDDHLQARGNSGHQVPEEERWAIWSEEDRLLLKPTED